MKIRVHITSQICLLVFVVVLLFRLLVVIICDLLYLSSSFLTRPRLLTERRGEQDANIMECLYGSSAATSKSCRVQVRNCVVIRISSPVLAMARVKSFDIKAVTYIAARCQGQTMVCCTIRSSMVITWRACCAVYALSLSAQLYCNSAFTTI